MRNYFEIKSIRIVTEFFLSALFLLPILPLNIANIVFIVFSTLSIGFALLSYKFINWKYVRFSYLISLAFIPYLIEYVANLNNHFVQVEFLKKLPFVFAPFAFAAFFSFIKFNNTNRLFTIFTIATTLIGIIGLFPLLLDNSLFDNESYVNGAFIIRQRFEDYSNLHPTYFGLFASISIFWLISKLYKSTSFYRILLASTIGILFITQLLIAAKAPFFITIIGSIWLVYKNTKSIKWFSIISIGIIGISLTVAVLSPALKNRLGEISDYFSSTNLKENTVNQRQLILHCNWEVLKDNLWFGTKNQHAQVLLDDCYQNNSKLTIEKGKYNSHNQYFTIAISYGIFVLLVFLIAMYTVLKKAKANYFLLATGGAFLAIMLTESILERQMGVYSFLIFNLVILNQTKRINY
jgi:O-antigen ligase